MLQHVSHAVNNVLGRPGDHENMCGNVDDVGINSEVNVDGGTEDLDSGPCFEHNTADAATSGIIANGDNLSSSDTAIAHRNTRYNGVDWANIM